jgi:hypothetical protein
MSLRQNIAENLPAKSKRTRIDDTGLRKRPQMEQIVNYLENGQERVKYPNRQAKFIRNHPYLTQLDFFDMQEDQERAWEEQKRIHTAKEIATQAGTSEAFEGAKISTRSRKDTGLPRPDGVSREEAQRQWLEDFENKRFNPDVWEEHDAESKTMQTLRKKRSDSVAQTVRFSLLDQTRHPDSDTPERIRPLPHGGKTPERMHTPTPEPGEKIPVPIGGKAQPSLPISVKADAPPGMLQRLFENVKAGYKFMVPADLTPRTKAAVEAEMQYREELEAWYKQQRDEEKERTILAYIDDQAKGDQEDGLESMLVSLRGGGEDEEDPSSSSSAAVRPRPRVPPSKKDPEGRTPKGVLGTGFHNKVGPGIEKAGAAFSGNKARQALGRAAIKAMSDMSAMI